MTTAVQPGEAKMREAFEAWYWRKYAEKLTLYTPKVGRALYISDKADASWSAWRAAAIEERKALPPHAEGRPEHTCPACHGAGSHEHFEGSEQCAKCGGTGALNTPVASPLPEGEREIERIMALSDAEVIAETIAAGEDPDKIVEKNRRLLDAAIIASRAADAAAVAHARAQSNSELQRGLMHDAFLAGAEYQRMVILNTRATPPGAAGQAVGDIVTAWETVSEGDGFERQSFDKLNADFKWHPLFNIAQGLRTAALFGVKGASYTDMMAVYANECAKFAAIIARHAAPLPEPAAVEKMARAIHAVMLKSEIGCAGSICKFANGCGCSEDLARAAYAALHGPQLG